MNNASRRSRIAYQVTLQRVGDYGFRSAITRLIALAVIAATLATVEPPWYAWAILAFAVFASYLSASDNFYIERPGKRPLEPLARASLRYNETSLGRNRPNIPGLAEMLCYVPLGILGPWLLTDQAVLARLICLSAALVYIASCLSAVFVDPAFYNPGITMPAFIEYVRSCVGPLSAAIATAVIVPAPWPTTESRVLAFGMCLGLIGVQLRLRETDRALVTARAFSDSEQVTGRQAITSPLHSRVGAPVDALHRYVERNRSHDPDLYDQYRLLVGGYRELIEMDLMADLDADWPGLLNGRLRQLMGSRGMQHTFTHPEEPLTRWNRLTATLVLDEFVTNAVKANATHCDVLLVYTAARNEYSASVTDDGGQISAAAWMREGGGLQRLERRLKTRGGAITYQVRPDGRKNVEARWTGSRNYVHG
ncbi:hypothetical protein [Rhodococcus sp. NPDC060176]|uniref:hypothetical protein n=1 Tax=Rhodococcus sp. NPDC060176 TaxID=3347062 RepID=UPI00365BD868